MSAPLKVECYAGHRADERPLRFSFVTAPSAAGAPVGRTGSPGGEPSRPRIYEVAELLDRWYGPDDEWFRVRADDGNLYVLRHHLTSDAWSLDAFRRGAQPSSTD